MSDGMIFRYMTNRYYEKSVLHNSYYGLPVNSDLDDQLLVEVTNILAQSQIITKCDFSICREDKLDYKHYLFNDGMLP